MSTTGIDLLATWMVELDRHLRIKTIRQPASTEQLSPFTNELPVGIPIFDAMGLPAREVAILTDQLLSATEIRSFHYTLDNQFFGRRSYVLSAAAVFGSAGEPKGYHCSIADLTMTLELAYTCRQHEAHFSSIFDTSPTFVTVTDLDGRFVRLNAAASRLLNHWNPNPVGRKSDEILPPELAQELRAQDAYILEAEHAAEFEQSYQIGENARVYLTTKFPVFDNEGSIVGVGTTGVDITERKRVEAELDRLVHYDSLTGLPNRRLCQEYLNDAALIAQHTGQRVAAIIVDLNNFRLINSTLGRATGDELLVEAAACLDRLGSNDATVTRLSAGEFCILHSSFDGRRQIFDITDRIHRQFSEPMQVGESELYVDVTIGAAIYPSDADGFDSLLRKAEMALQEAKRRDLTTMMFTEGMDRAIEERAHMVNLLRRALEREELSVVYQPIIDATTGLPTTLEALLRWHCPALGAVSPATFIPIAEETGLIQAIGDWTMRQACRDAVDWNRQRRWPIGVSVNVSPKQLLAPGFVESVQQTLADAGLTTALLKIEITESCLVRDVLACRRVIDALANLGVVLALDDFGTGYSALSYLQNFRFDFLKLDQSFVRKITPGDPSAALTASIVSLAKSLGMKTVAEGVENLDHVNILRFQGCEFLQGYYFSKPLPWHQLNCMVAPALAA